MMTRRLQFNRGKLPSRTSDDIQQLLRHSSASQRNPRTKTSRLEREHQRSLRLEHWYETLDLPRPPSLKRIPLAEEPPPPPPPAVVRTTTGTTTTGGDLSMSSFCSSLATQGESRRRSHNVWSTSGHHRGQLRVKYKHISQVYSASAVSVANNNHHQHHHSNSTSESTRSSGNQQDNSKSTSKSSGGTGEKKLLWKPLRGGREMRGSTESTSRDATTTESSTTAKWINCEQRRGGGMARASTNRIISYHHQRRLLSDYETTGKPPPPPQHCEAVSPAARRTVNFVTQDLKGSFEVATTAAGVDHQLQHGAGVLSYDPSQFLSFRHYTLLYNCGCTGCAAYIRFVDERKRRGDKVSSLEKTCFQIVPQIEKSASSHSNKLFPAKDKYTQTSVSCNSSWTEIFFNCFRCGGGNESESLSSAGSDSGDDDDGDGGDDSDGGDEHGDEMSVGEDSGGGDDAGSEDASMNSAEAIEGDGNQIDNRGNNADGDGDDGEVGSCCSDGTDSLTELRARFALTRKHLLARKSNYSSRQTARGGRSGRTCRGFGPDDDDDADESGSDDLEESLDPDEEDSMAEFAMLDDDG